MVFEVHCWRPVVSPDASAQICIRSECAFQNLFRLLSVLWDEFQYRYTNGQWSLRSIAGDLSCHLTQAPRSASDRNAHFKTCFASYLSYGMNFNTAIRTANGL